MTAPLDGVNGTGKWSGACGPQSEGTRMRRRRPRARVARWLLGRLGRGLFALGGRLGGLALGGLSCGGLGGLFAQVDLLRHVHVARRARRRR